MMAEPEPKPPNRNPHITPIIGRVEDSDDQIYNWHGAHFLTGKGKGTRVLDDIQHRRKHTMQNVILIACDPGTGKSYFGMRLAEILEAAVNKGFIPEIQIVFERMHLLRLLGPDSPLKMGSVIIIDEAQFSTGSRHWFEDAQRDLMDHFEAVRSKGYIIILVALHQSLLDKILRKHVINCKMNMNQRGQATVYKMFMPQFEDEQHAEKLGLLSLQLPDYKKCAYENCLICKFMDKCMTHRARYERMKREFLDRMNLNSQEKSRAKSMVKITGEEFTKLTQIIIMDKDKLWYNKDGRVDTDAINYVLDKRGINNLSSRDEARLRKRGIREYPGIFTNPKKLTEVKKDE